jgi:hypothetical protein
VSKIFKAVATTIVKPGKVQVTLPEKTRLVFLSKGDRPGIWQTEKPGTYEIDFQETGAPANFPIILAFVRAKHVHHIAKLKQATIDHIVEVAPRNPSGALH